MGLGEKLRQAMDRLRGASALDKETVRAVIKDLQRALIAGDVDVSLVLQASKEIEKEAFGELPKGMNRREHVLKATYDRLAGLLGTAGKIPEKPSRILLVGLFGFGKTTTTAKLANYYKKRGLKVGVIGADVMRPAAYEQLQQLSGQLKIDFYGNPKEKKAEKVVREGLEKLKGVDLIIVDSAGRSALDSELTEEMKNIHKEFRPEHTWLILGADMGQLAGKQAQAFHDAVGVNGLVITRMDGSAKGGGALAACARTKAPVYFIGTGEKANDLEAFDSQRYLGRIMGYGDIQGLLEKAKEAETEEIDIEAMMKGEFNLDMFYKQLKQARQIGPLNKIAEMLGISMQVPKEQLELGEEKLDSFKSIMDSMTFREKLEPELLNSSRISRIAKGSGTKDTEVRELIKHYKQMKKMFKRMKDLNPEKIGKRGFDMSSFGKKFAKKKKFRIR